ncbi:YoaK family protein [Pullulanibacillus sp. KACC 23026]|uniref:YoaK family protein n=1 Tax=Pullulanibacillus sp. KACC 23026 TaxID=3028315 RepID=UPI0023AF349A|nr:YoaK family protein [Pullulanibacillus sp. KACC 23026]WEG14705.1 YoaK family protein [Pullulanibacillus sp. KACC 23026]
MKKMETVLAILLTMTSGCSDAIGFLALGEVLTAAMTGNTVFLGLSLVHAGGLKPLGYLVALLGFMLGVAVGAILLRKRQRVTGLHPIVTSAICLELVAFILFGILVTCGVIQNHLLLIIILTFAMGVQGITARRIGVNGVPTTVITSTTTGLIESLIWNLYNVAAHKGKRVDANAPTSLVPSSSIFIWLIDIIIYGIGAAICGAVVLKWHLEAIWLPTALVFVVVLSSLFFQLQVGQKKRKKPTNTISL